MRPLATSTPIGLLALALPLALACAPEAPPPPTAARGSFAYGTAPEAAADEAPLLELSYEGGLIKNPDPTPFVRVYPGGRVLIHYPAYMKRAGDYELQLGEREIEELLSSFATPEVLDAEPETLAAMAAEVRAEEGLVEPVDDHGVAAVVEIRAESFTPAGADEPTLLDVERRLVAQELPPAELEVAPRFQALSDLATGVRALEALAARPDLEPVAPETPPATPEPPR